MVRDGILEATYLYPTKGEEVIALAMKILRGEPYEHDHFLQTSLVTRDNAELTLMEARESMRQHDNLDRLPSKWIAIWPTTRHNSGCWQAPS